jgi:hypothetical protein
MKDIFTGIIYFPLNMVNCVHIFVVISLSRVIEFYMVASLVEYWCGAWCLYGRFRDVISRKRGHISILIWYLFF